MRKNEKSVLHQTASQRTMQDLPEFVKEEIRKKVLTLPEKVVELEEEYEPVKEYRLGRPSSDLNKQSLRQYATEVHKKLVKTKKALTSCKAAVKLFTPS